jgi:ribosomal protein S27E
MAVTPVMAAQPRSIFESYRCPDCTGAITWEGEGWQCADCGHVLNHGAD